MISVIRINLLYLQTVLESQPGPVSQYKMQVSNTFTVNFIFCSAKGNTWRLKNIFCNRNDPKKCINTWQITKVSSTKRRADNSGNHADL